MPFEIGRSIHRYFLVHTPFYQTDIDKKLEGAPYAAVGLLRIFGVKTRSGWMKQVLVAGATEAIRYFVTDSLKKITSNHRPFPNAGNHSFPSGDTSSSFSAAEFMHQELKGSLGFFSCAGYVAGAATGTVRLMKNKHWLKDVIAGAIIGIASARLAYWLFSKLEKAKKEKQTTSEIENVHDDVVGLISEKIKSPHQQIAHD